MLTPEQRLKLKKAGYSDTKINVFEAQKTIKEKEAQSQEPSFLGKVARETIRPLAKLGTSLINTAQIATGQPETQPFSGDYLGEVERIGKNFDVTKGFTPENISALKDAAKTGIDIGLLVSGGSGAGTVAKTGIKEGIMQGIKTGAKTGAIIGGTSGASTGLEEGATVGSTIQNTAIGTVGGGVVGGVVGGVTGAVSPVLKGVKTGLQKTGKYADSKVPKLLSIFTGESDDVVNSALKNPKIADLGIKGGDEALRKAVQIGSESSIKAKTTFIKAHSEAFKQLAAKNPGKLLQGKKVLYDFVDDLTKQGVKVKNGKLDFSTSKIVANPGEIGKIQAAYKAIQGWKNWSVEGGNELKQLVGQLTKFATEQGGSSKSPTLGKFYNYLDTEIKNALPEASRKAYSEMNKKFTNSIGLYDDMVDAFNSGDPFTKMAQIFGNNKDTLRQVVGFYEKTTGNKISPIVAGRTLAESKPAAFGFLNPRQWIDFFIDPKTQAKIVTKVGTARQSLSKMSSKNIVKTGTNIANSQVPKINNRKVIPTDISQTIQKVNALPTSEINTTLERALASAEQTLDTLPKSEISKLGGIVKLIENTRKNIVLELKGKGFKTIANKINKIDLSSIKSIDDLDTAILEITKGI